MAVTSARPRLAGGLVDAINVKTRDGQVANRGGEPPCLFGATEAHS